MAIKLVVCLAALTVVKAALEDQMRTALKSSPSTLLHKKTDGPAAPCSWPGILDLNDSIYNLAIAHLLGDTTAAVL
ncbi:MAG TPA: hypothetical protein VJG32_07405 [Anaerolineae bacterium]|nr:hypothetical protein [Anaerolineae bacterium]